MDDPPSLCTDRVLSQAQLKSNATRESASCLTAPRRIRLKKRVYNEANGRGGEEIVGASQFARRVLRRTITGIHWVICPPALPYFDERSECKAENLATAFAVSGHSDLNGLPAGFDPKLQFITAPADRRVGSEADIPADSCTCYWLCCYVGHIAVQNSSYSYNRRSDRTSTARCSPRASRGV